MSGLNPYLVAAYALSLAILWGYAIHVWIALHGLRKHQRREP